LGSVILPGLLLISHSPFLIGYAKPVPYNPYNLRGKHAEGLVAFAGPGTNILIAIIFGLLIRFGAATLGPALVSAFGVIVVINLMLALFNLIPIPPIDGSKVLASLFGLVSKPLERGYQSFMANFERMGMIPMILIVLVIFNYILYPYFTALLGFLFVLLTGLSI
jgi:Zn-dependent protease